MTTCGKWQYASPVHHSLEICLISFNQNTLPPNLLQAKFYVDYCAPIVFILLYLPHRNIRSKSSISSFNINSRWSPQKMSVARAKMATLTSMTNIYELTSSSGKNGSVQHPHLIWILSDKNTFVQPSATRKGQDLPSATDGNLCLEKVAIRQACLSHCYLVDKLRNNETVQTEDGLICIFAHLGKSLSECRLCKGNGLWISVSFACNVSCELCKESCYWLIFICQVSRGAVIL